MRTTNSNDQRTAALQGVGAYESLKRMVSFTAQHRPELLRRLRAFQLSCNLPSSFIEKEATIRLFTFLNPDVIQYLPTPRELDAVVLDEATMAEVRRGARTQR
ncbi:hypothetical protein Poli38472_000221 [Pythium oligandrum]|uniref:Uncharacterized protein n=1 Tax=Pythium oligandrum TaxID=41045 RepID=A0A8K1FGM9_PYTOL|nr:hypothetical protein Poli38472_000221 [Pythium oligandrum]|eukprot:TMW60179.1 hypothetical protein Poli38472_000221 [Pythium oligandrum]